MAICPAPSLISSYEKTHGVEFLFLFLGGIVGKRLVPYYGTGPCSIPCEGYGTTPVPYYGTNPGSIPTPWKACQLWNHVLFHISEYWGPDQIQVNPKTDSTISLAFPRLKCLRVSRDAKLAKMDLRGKSGSEVWNGYGRNI